jgi:hypothetical protein
MSRTDVKEGCHGNMSSKEGRKEGCQRRKEVGMSRKEGRKGQGQEKSEGAKEGRNKGRKILIFIIATTIVTFIVILPSRTFQKNVRRLRVSSRQHFQFPPTIGARRKEDSHSQGRGQDFGWSELWAGAEEPPKTAHAHNQRGQEKSQFRTGRPAGGAGQRADFTH